MSNDLPSDHGFVGSIPEIYDRFMVPLIFTPYAVDLCARIRALPVGPLLEIAAGTGAVTREMADRLDPGVDITATDLNQPMIDHAARVGTSRPVTWRQADVFALPFADQSFETVVCQFGVMFFPDKARAFAEIRRVLRSGGTFIFNLWDSLDLNDFARTVNEPVASHFGDDAPDFFARIPHGYHDPATVQADLVDGGFVDHAVFDVVAARSRSTSPRHVAIGYCQGTPLRTEIVSREPDGLEAMTDRVEAAIAATYGATDLDGAISAVVVTVTAP
ncbi:MAG: phcB5 [Acidimicrobiales bacterium]|nr:phcB5 [Acidimicrobiales bacterium]